MPSLHSLAIVPSGPGGVRDHARTLHDELAERGRAGGLEVIASDSAVRRTLRGLRWALRRRRGERAILHYSVFSWSYRGVPTPLVLLPLLLRLRGVQVCCILHEFAFPWTWSPRQIVWAASQRLALPLVLLGSSGLVVTTSERRRWIERRIGRRASCPVREAPVFSTVPVAHDEHGDATTLGGDAARASPTDGPRRARHVVVPAWSDPGAEAVAGSLLGVEDPLRITLLGAPAPDGHPMARPWFRLAAHAPWHQVEFSGVVDGPRFSRTVQAADLVLLIYRDGPTGRRTTLASALQHGAPVLAVDGVDTSARLKQRRAIALTTIPALATDLPALLGDDRELDRLSTAAISAYEALHHISHTVDAVEGSLALSSTSTTSTVQRKPRLLYVAHQVWPSGGMERYSSELLRRLNEDFEVTVLSRRVAPEVAQQVARVVRVPLPGRPVSFLFPAFYVLAGIWASWMKHDLLHTEGAIIPNRTDVSTVHLSHTAVRARTGRLSPGASGVRRINSDWVHALAYVAERWTYRSSRSRILISVSQGLTAELLDGHGHPRIETVPLSVDTESFRPDARRRREARAARGTSTDALVVAFVGGNWAHKGLKHVIEGAARAQQELARPVEVWILGRGERSGLPNPPNLVLHFFGQVPGVERWLPGADLLCLPSESETFALAAWEGAACGLPVVATELPGICELIGDDESAGRFVEPSAASVASAIVEVGADRSLREELAEVAVHRARGRNWGDVATESAGIYWRLLEESGWPPRAREPDEEAT